LYFSRFNGQRVSSIERQIEPYFSNYVASKTVSESATVPMKGFAFDIAPDGNIPNVTFSRNSAGQCTTVVQWQKENPTIFPMYDELSASQRARATSRAMTQNQKRQAGQLQAFLTRKGIT
jgi:hypothetical protein